jgi:hypothetical protein
LRVGNGAFFLVSNIFHQPFGFTPEGHFFFAVGPFGPAAFFISLSRGRVAAGVQQKPKKEPNMANRNTKPGIGKNADSGVMHYPQCARACAYTRGGHKGQLIGTLNHMTYGSVKGDFSCCRDFSCGRVRK